MRNNQNLPNRQINSNNVNGRKLPPTSPYITTREAEDQIDITDTRVTKAADHITIIADTPAGHIVTIDRIVTIDLTATIDLETDTSIITAVDQTAITEIIVIIIVIIRTPGIATIVITEIIVITVQITITVTIQDIIHDHHINLHGHHINLDHRIIETEVQITILIIIITEADTIVMIEIEIQAAETNITDEIITTITEVTRKRTNDKVKME